MNDSNSSSFEEHGTYVTQRTIVNLILSLTTLVSITANATIIYVICQFKLRSTTFKLLLHCCIIYIIGIIVSPLGMELVREINRDWYVSVSLDLIVYIFLDLMWMKLFILVLFVFVDVIKVITKYDGYIIKFIWGTLAVSFVVTLLAFFIELNHFLHLLLSTVIYAILFLFLCLSVVVKSIVRCVKETRRNDVDETCRMKLVVYYIYLRVFSVVLIVVVFYFSYFSIWLQVFAHVLFESPSVMNVYILIKNKDEFKIFVHQLFNKRTARYNGTINFNNEENA